MPLCEDCWEESDTTGVDEPPPIPWYGLVEKLKEELGLEQAEAESRVAEQECSRCGGPLTR